MPLARPAATRDRQLVIAIGFLSRRTVKAAITGSILWSLMVWWLGEGLGGLLAGPQSPVTGAPGAAVLYSLISLLVWPPATDGDRVQEGSVAAGSPARAVLARLVWLVLWASFAFQSVQTANRSPSALHHMVTEMALGEPAWLRATIHGFVSVLDHHGTEVSVALAATFGLIALSTLAGRRLARGGVLAAISTALLIWLVGEDLGQIATGRATDPNTGPLLVLLAAAYWPVTALACGDGPTDAIGVGGTIGATSPQCGQLPRSHPSCSRVTGGSCGRAAGHGAQSTETTPLVAWLDIGHGE